MLSGCNIIKILLFLELENFVEPLMLNIYLRSHSPENDNNTLWDFKFDQTGFQTFISDSLDFLGSSMWDYHAQKKNHIFQIKCNQFTLIIKNPTKPLMFVRKIQKNVDNSALVRNYWSNNNGYIKTIS